MFIKSAAPHSDAPKLGELECKRRRINRTQCGGDANTAGAIAGIPAWAVYGLEEISEAWLKALDAGTRRSC
jgi:ADP-ribosylglycohydrolase